MNDKLKSVSNEYINDWSCAIRAIEEETVVISHPLLSETINHIKSMISNPASSKSIEWQGDFDDLFKTANHSGLISYCNTLLSRHDEAGSDEKIYALINFINKVRVEYELLQQMLILRETLGIISRLPWMKRIYYQFKIYSTLCSMPPCLEAIAEERKIQKQSWMRLLDEEVKRREALEKVQICDEEMTALMRTDQNSGRMLHTDLSGITGNTAEALKKGFQALRQEQSNHQFKSQLWINTVKQGSFVSKETKAEENEPTSFSADSYEAYKSGDRSGKGGSSILNSNLARRVSSVLGLQANKKGVAELTVEEIISQGERIDKSIAFINAYFERWVNEEKKTAQKKEALNKQCSIYKELLERHSSQLRGKESFDYLLQQDYITKQRLARLAQVDETAFIKKKPLALMLDKFAGACFSLFLGVHGLAKSLDWRKKMQNKYGIKAMRVSVLGGYSNKASLLARLFRLKIVASLMLCALVIGLVVSKDYLFTKAYWLGMNGMKASALGIGSGLCIGVLVWLCYRIKTLNHQKSKWQSDVTDKHALEALGVDVKPLEDNAFFISSENALASGRLMPEESVSTGVIEAERSSSSTQSSTNLFSPRARPERSSESVIQATLSPIQSENDGIQI